MLFVMCVFQLLVLVPDLIPPQRFPRHQFSSGFHEQVLSFAVLICFRVAHPSLPPGFVFLNAEFFSRSLYFCFAAAGVRRLFLSSIAFLVHLVAPCLAVIGRACRLRFIHRHRIISHSRSQWARPDFPVPISLCRGHNFLPTPALAPVLPAASSISVRVQRRTYPAQARCFSRLFPPGIFASCFDPAVVTLILLVRIARTGRLCFRCPVFGSCFLFHARRRICFWRQEFGLCFFS